MSWDYLMLWLFVISTCFITGSVGRQAIIGGHKARIERFPYLVSLQNDKKNICGGAIIGEKFILTGAHCVLNQFGYPYSHVTVVAGTSNLFNHDKTTVIVDVKRAFVTKHFNVTSRPAHGDIGVLKLKHPLKLSNHGNLQKIHLPTDASETFHGKKAEMAGFGWNHVTVHQTDRDGSNTDGRLQFGDVDIVSNGCLPGLVDDSNLCAKMQQPYHPEISGTCAGDSGGPLIYNRTFVIGILSMGPITCNEKDFPSIYTRVTYYLDFIHRAMNGKKTSDMREIDF